MDHLKLTEFECIDPPFIKNVVAIYDERDLSAAEVNEAIELYPLNSQHYPFIVFMLKKQYDNVFREVREKLRNA